MADDQIEIRVAGMQATVSIRVAAAGSPRDAGRLDPQLRGVEVAGDEAIMACLIALEGPLIAELFRSYGAWSNDRLAIRVKLPAAGDERAVRSNAAWLLSAARKLRRAATPPTATTLLAAMNRANTAELRASCFALLIERLPESTEAAEARRLEKNASPGQLALPEATAIAGAVSVASTPGAVSIAKKVTT